MSETTIPTELLLCWARAYHRLMLDPRLDGELRMKMCLEMTGEMAQMLGDHRLRPADLPPGLQDNPPSAKPDKPKPPTFNRQHKFAVERLVGDLAKGGRTLKVVELNPGAGELTAAIAGVVPPGTIVRCIGQWNSGGGGQNGQHDATTFPFFLENTAGLPVEWKDDDPLDVAVNINVPYDADLVVITEGANRDLVDAWLPQLQDGGSLICFDEKSVKHIPGHMARHGVGFVQRRDPPPTDEPIEEDEAEKDTDLAVEEAVA